VTQREAKLLVVSNRLPVERKRGEWQPAAGGLVTALAPALARRGGTWIGWAGGAAEVPPHVHGLDVDLAAVPLDRRLVDGYYHGFSNRALWPLLHGLVDQIVFERSHWNAYREANALFAEAAAGASAGGRAIVWVQDYHLMLVPAALRELAPGAAIGFFSHIPWAAPELVARLPWRDALVDGLLGADVVGFHTEEYRSNFVQTVARLRDDVRVRGRTLELPDGRRVATVAHPISIDTREFGDQARAPGVERCLHPLRRQFEGRRVLVGVDRLDYTKGIPERLRAIELLLESRPDLRGSVAYVQIAVPSREQVQEYRVLRRQVEELVGRINGRFTEPGRDVPVHYLFRGVPRERLLAYYRVADACLVTPLRDGMNLVAKEFVTAQGAVGGAGALVLSEFTGAAEQLRDALRCNPFDAEGLAAVIGRALELDEDDRRRRIRRMADTVARHDIHWWTEQQLGAIEAAA